MGELGPSERWIESKTEYKKEYRRGWRASLGPNASLDRTPVDVSDAWYDGYGEIAYGFGEKYHRMNHEAGCERCDSPTIIRNDERGYGRWYARYY